jgi:hypothetical protein
MPKHLSEKFKQFENFMETIFGSKLRFRVFPNFEISWFLGFRVSKFRGIKVSRNQGIVESRHRNQGVEVSGF